MGYPNVSNAINGSNTISLLAYNLADQQLHQVGNIREQDLPGHLERLERARQLIGRRKWNDFDGASILKAVEASREKFQPGVLSIVLVILAVTGTFFVTVIYPKTQSKL
jgi:hypothetical protein